VGKLRKRSLISANLLVLNEVGEARQGAKCQMSAPQAAGSLVLGLNSELRTQQVSTNAVEPHPIQSLGRSTFSKSSSQRRWF
jgi:hypothetical protein